MKIYILLLTLSLVSCATEQKQATVKNYHTGHTIINNISNTGRYDPVYKSVVKIINKKDRSMGAGFIFKNINGNSYVMSVQHLCIRRGQAMEVHTVPDQKNRKEVFFAKVVYVNKKDDVCIARAYDTGKRFMPIEFSKTSPRIGDKIMTIGASVGMFPTKTDGYVIGHDLLGVTGPDSKGVSRKKLLVSAPAAAGNSGGPVYNESFQVVALLSARHPEFNHSSLCIHVDTLLRHVGKYFKRKSRK